MAMVYRIHLDLEFDTQVKRDAWYTKMKTAIGNMKVSDGATTLAVIVKDSYDVPERVVENV